MIRPMNVLVIQSDQHNPSYLGSESPSWITPSLDSLSRRGTRFSHAYCTSPICVPSRASFATGRYPHDLGNWDNAAPYVGIEADSWGHRVTDRGRHVTTIGKLHFRQSGDPTGFSDQRIPMHVPNGIGDLYWLLRGDAEPNPWSRSKILGAGSGESEYTRYDREVARLAESWLASEAGAYDRGWVLYVSFVSPHFPWIAPPEFHALYDQASLPLPVNWERQHWPSHPALDSMRRLEDFADPFSEAEVRGAVHAYAALVSFMDNQVGRVLTALETSGLSDSTLVIYTSDHGEMAGQHGMWAKHVLYESSARVPLIMAGPGIPANSTVEASVSQVDMFPTILQATDCPVTPEDGTLPGVSLLEVIDGKYQSRPVFSEYHAHYSANASYMVRSGSLKLIYYVGDRPQLFDLAADPYETRDISGERSGLLDVMLDILREFVDPEKMDLAAKRSGAARISHAGGQDTVRRLGPIVHSPPPAQFRE